MSQPFKLAIAGAQGRMGRSLVSALADEPDFVFVGDLGRIRTEEDVVTRAKTIETADVILDFTTGQAAAALAMMCGERGGPALVIGATGFELNDLALIKEATRRVPIVRSGNFSIGLNMIAGFVAQVARTFPPEVWDIEILEAHHRHKIDAPSGTALMLGEAAALGRGVSLASVERLGRNGTTSERPHGEIGFSVVRGGGIIGEHSIMFAAADEVVTFSHSALNREMFARGAILAARWVIDQAPGAYDMQDVLALPYQSSAHHDAV